MILDLVEEAVSSGARQQKACEILGVDPRSLQRWTRQETGTDGRAGPRTVPANKLSKPERLRLLQMANSPENRDLSPKQIVPKMADKGLYIASESTLYRVLREEKQLKHRETSRSPKKRCRPDALLATGPNQVWSWDITYLKSPVRGLFFYLYLMLDVWSRKIVGWEVHETETSEEAAWLMIKACYQEGISPDQLVLHSDNGGPMKGATMLATLQALGVAASFSRPRVSNDNPYSESLFRTAKYRPEYPSGPFSSLDAAREWVLSFVHWYNTMHRHSGISFVTPDQRHNGRDVEILARRHALYQRARARHPERWTGKTRNWSPIKVVHLNKPLHQTASEVA